MKVGGHTTNADIYEDLMGINQGGPTFLQFDGTDGSDWVSVFGSTNEDNPAPIGSSLASDNAIGTNDWKTLFGDNILSSPFQDGHYIYIVIPGYGTGEDVVAPRICVADGESPKHLHKIMDL